jgi:hypothetical protein
VTANADARTLGPMHEHRRIPANPRTISAFKFFIAGKLGLVLSGNGIDVVRRWHDGHAEVELTRTLEQTEHNLSTTTRAASGNEIIERLLPFSSLLRIWINIVN